MSRAQTPVPRVVEFPAIAFGMFASSPATSARKKALNLSVLKRFDPNIEDIIESATHVALYTFKENRSWVECAMI